MQTLVSKKRSDKNIKLLTQELRRCGHHFHRSCLKEWLSLNRKCPLCKQDFRGKEYDEDSEDEDADDDIVGESSRQGEVIQLNQLNR